ncbi:hypothetical protein [Paenibacillus macerans]|uniref:hypothetical protein n=1 Tax=Paenibacillus macerans TaxID=44252 RepID=UPI003D3139D4
MDTGLEMLKRRLPPAFAREIETRQRDGSLISLAGPQGDGGGWPPERENGAAGGGNSERQSEGKKGKAEPPGDAVAPTEGVGTKESAAGQADSLPGKKKEIDGDIPLLVWLAAAYRESEVGGTDPQQLLLAESADGALDLLLRALVPGGGAVLVETPASPEALELMRRRGIRAVPVACDRDGMLPDDLRRKCKTAGGQPALVYVTPHGSGPSGRVWSRPRKLALLALSERLTLPIVEDDTAGETILALIGKAFAAEERNSAVETASAEERMEEVGEPAGAEPIGVAAGPVQPAPREVQAGLAEPSLDSFCRLRQQAGCGGAEVIGIGSLERTLTPQLPLAWLRGEAKTLERLRRVPAPGSSSAAGVGMAERAGRLHAWLEVAVGISPAPAP